jgi:hypothetical protein
VPGLGARVFDARVFNAPVFNAVRFVVPALAAPVVRAAEPTVVFLRAAMLVVPRFVPVDADFGLAVRAGAALAAETLTNPRAVPFVAVPVARRTVAAAFAAGRRFCLLRGVVAMGTTLVTVATW